MIAAFVVVSVAAFVVAFLLRCPCVVVVFVVAAFVVVAVCVVDASSVLRHVGICGRGWCSRLK
eukprot:scaffold2339_cov180-Alexandrium_tamarense.AAC.6